MAVEASIVVVFGDDADTTGIVQVELDPLDSRNHDSEGGVKSQFNCVDLPVDTPALLFHHSSTLSITDIIATDGTIGPNEGATSQTREVDYSFATSSDKSSIGYADTTNLSYSSRGNSASLAIDGNDIVVTGGTVPCVGLATVTVSFQEKRTLTPPHKPDLGDDETYSITVFVFVA